MSDEVAERRLRVLAFGGGVDDGGSWVERPDAES
jgi:hypothetical protein